MLRRPQKETPVALFQKAPQSPEELEACQPLETPPDAVLEMTEEEWYEHIYRGDSVPQLTIRAVLLGSVLGFLLAFTNLYIGLKTGWGLGVAITACILAYALWNVLEKAGLAKTPMTILETNCMQSTASSAGYSTGGTMVSAIAALLMLSATEANPAGVHLPWPILAGWTIFLAALGTLMAIPMKRNMINKERLKFPSGTAAAVTLQSLYAAGEGAIKKARALAYAALAGALFPLVLEFGWLREKVSFLGKIPHSSKIFDWLPGRGTDAKTGEAFAPSDWLMVMDHNPVMIAAGAIVGLRIAIYMMVGGLALGYVVGPMGYENEVTIEATGKLLRAATTPGNAWKEIGIWLGVPIMVASGLLTFAMQWKTIARAFTSFFKKDDNGESGDGHPYRENQRPEDEPLESLIARTEVPTSWFINGTIVASVGAVGIAQFYFDIPFYYGILAVLMTFFLALVACRATGESDITPVGAMGKIMQLTYGILIPQSTTANLMTASITASSAGSSADLLNDLKSGYLLGANPRRQFMAQFLGIFAGTIATVWGFYMLVPSAVDLLGDGTTAPQFPAPAAQAWKAVAEVFKMGLDNMHPMHQQAIFWGLSLGTAMVILEKVLPKFRQYLPSATGIGLGLILPFQYPLSMLIGAVIAWFWVRKNKEQCDDYLIPIASGLIAGISIMGVLVAVIDNLI
jgi:OPT family oligopeptide transporter